MDEENEQIYWEDEPLPEEVEELKKCLMPNGGMDEKMRVAKNLLILMSHDHELAEMIVGRWFFEIQEAIRQTNDPFKWAACLWIGVDKFSKDAMRKYYPTEMEGMTFDKLLKRGKYAEDADTGGE